jgi:hypothetical protein
MPDSDLKVDIKAELKAALSRLRTADHLVLHFGFLRGKKHHALLITPKKITDVTGELHAAAESDAKPVSGKVYVGKNAKGESVLVFEAHAPATLEADLKKAAEHYGVHLGAYEVRPPAPADAPAAPTPSADGGPQPPPAAAPAGPTAEEITHALKGLQHDFETALHQAPGPQAAELKAQFTLAMHELQKHRPDLAAPALERLRAGIKQALAPAPPVAPPPPPAAPPPQAPPAPSAEVLQLKERLQLTLAGLKRAGVDLAQHPDWQNLLTRAGAAAKGHHFAEGLALLGQLDDALEAAGVPLRPAPVQPAPAAPAAEVKAGGFVGYAQARLLWRQTRDRAGAELQALKKAIIETYAGLPEQEDARDAVDDLDRALAGFDDRLEDLLDKGLNATAERRQAINAQAVDVIRDYQKFVEGEPLFADLDDNPFQPVTITRTVRAVLNTLASKLQSS